MIEPRAGNRRSDDGRPAPHDLKQQLHADGPPITRGTPDATPAEAYAAPIVHLVAVAVTPPNR